MERSMHIQHERPWPAIDVAELRFGLAFGASVEELADFLLRDVEDVRHQVDVEANRGGAEALSLTSGVAIGS
jgi:hypothetical protein